MGEVLPFPEQPDPHLAPVHFRQAPIWQCRPEDRLIMARNDIDFQAWADLKKNGFTDVSVSEYRQDELSFYSDDEMAAELQELHGISKEAAQRLAHEWHEEIHDDGAA